MNTSPMSNVITMLRCWCYANISMNVFGDINDLMVQIAQGWRGTSLPWVGIRKEIQRHRC